MFKKQILQNAGHFFPLGRNMSLALAMCCILHSAHAYSDDCEHLFGDKSAKLFLSPANPSPKPANSKSHILGRTYFIFTDEFANGALIDIEKNLPNLQRIGVDIVWNSPVQTQIEEHVFRGTETTIATG